MPELNEETQHSVRMVFSAVATYIGALVETHRIASGQSTGLDAFMVAEVPNLTTSELLNLAIFQHASPSVEALDGPLGVEYLMDQPGIRQLANDFVVGKLGMGKTWDAAMREGRDPYEDPAIEKAVRLCEDAISATRRAFFTGKDGTSRRLAQQRAELILGVLAAWTAGPPDIANVRVGEDMDLVSAVIGPMYSAPDYALWNAGKEALIRGADASSQQEFRAPLPTDEELIAARKQRDAYGREVDVQELDERAVFVRLLMGAWYDEIGESNWSSQEFRQSLAEVMEANLSRYRKTCPHPQQIEAMLRRESEPVISGQVPRSPLTDEMLDVDIRARGCLELLKAEKPLGRNVWDGEDVVQLSEIVAVGAVSHAVEDLAAVSVMKRNQRKNFVPADIYQLEIDLARNRLERAFDAGHPLRAERDAALDEAQAHLDTHGNKLPPLDQGLAEMIVRVREIIGLDPISTDRPSIEPPGR